MPRYRHVFDQKRIYPALGLELEPGEEFETDQVLDHPNFLLLDKPKGEADSVTEPTDAAETEPPTTKE